MERSQADIEAQDRMDESIASVNAKMREAAASGGVCDFCGCPLAGTYETTYKARTLLGSFSALTNDLGAATAPIVQDPWWAACAACAPLVEERDPGKLADHVIETQLSNRRWDDGVSPEFVKAHAATLRDDFVTLYEALFKHGLEKVAMPPCSCGIEKDENYGMIRALRGKNTHALACPRGMAERATP